MRYGELDGLRGLAALAVFLSHVSLMLPAPSFFERAALTPLHVLWDGAAAVDLFFVLSGFVLALPFVGDTARELSYPAFMLRRALRILPAYWASLLLALVVRDMLYAPAGLTDLTPWSQQFWLAPVRHVLDHVLLLAPWSGSWSVHPVLSGQ